MTTPYHAFDRTDWTRSRYLATAAQPLDAIAAGHEVLREEGVLVPRVLMAHTHETVMATPELRAAMEAEVKR